MRTNGFVVVAALCATLSPGQSNTQSVQRVFEFAHTQTARTAQQIATAIRTISEANQVQVDGGSAAATLTVHGTAEQIKLAEWLFVHLDEPANAQPDPAGLEYRLPGSGDNVVRIYNVTHAATVQELQEIATAVRTIGDIRRIFVNNPQRAIVVRGTEDRMALAEWLLEQMDKPSSEAIPHSASPAYRMPDERGEGVVRVFYAGHVATMRDFQQMALAIRTMAEIRRLFIYNGPRAMAVRGTADQVALAQWLFDALDGQIPSTTEHPAIGGNGDVVRVFYVAQASTVEDFQKIAARVRSATPAQRVVACDAPRAVLLLGTPGQIASAARLIKALSSF